MLFGGCKFYPATSSSIYVACTVNTGTSALDNMLCSSRTERVVDGDTIGQGYNEEAPAEEPNYFQQKRNVTGNISQIK